MHRPKSSLWNFLLIYLSTYQTGYNGHSRFLCFRFSISLNYCKKRQVRYKFLLFKFIGNMTSMLWILQESEMGKLMYLRQKNKNIFKPKVDQGCTNKPQQRFCAV